MKKMSVSLSLILAFVTFSISQIVNAADAQGNPPVKKPRVVSITFSPAQSKAKRKLTHSEALRQAASIRHEKRLQAGYNQAIPF